eukprot:CAMPEP_0194283466 /NCGR_PEP_ID=MMETSP0169-20130528/25419_1 /TAXON_ID=218684 /ORGANISM="Corethron pennatum, Strain L29A3" /LENGTH=762 /DNA_ID=CAMNT_0039029075 /DNA_START=60 /DNA_END=2345 /DNA_ORIENTATION=+
MSSVSESQLPSSPNLREKPQMNALEMKQKLNSQNTIISISSSDKSSDSSSDPSDGENNSHLEIINEPDIILPQNNADNNNKEEQSSSILTGSESKTNGSYGGDESETQVNAESVDGITVVEGDTKLKMIASGTWARSITNGATSNNFPEKNSTENEDTETKKLRDSQRLKHNESNQCIREVSETKKNNKMQVKMLLKAKENNNEKIIKDSTEKFNIIAAGRWTTDRDTVFSNSSEEVSYSVPDSLTLEESLGQEVSMTHRHNDADSYDSGGTNGMSVTSILSMMLHRKFRKSKSKSDGNRVDDNEKPSSPNRYDRGTYRHWLTEQIYNNSSLSEKKTDANRLRLLDIEKGGEVGIRNPSNIEVDHKRHHRREMKRKKIQAETTLHGENSGEEGENAELAVTGSLPRSKKDPKSERQQEVHSTDALNIKSDTRWNKNSPTKTKRLDKDSDNTTAQGHKNQGEHIEYGNEVIYEDEINLKNNTEDSDGRVSEGVDIDSLNDKELEGLDRNQNKKIKQMICSKSSDKIQREASILHRTWRNPHDHQVLSIPVAKRMVYYKKARELRDEKYSNNFWSVTAMYAHFQGIKTDVEWSEGAAKNLGGKFSSWSKYDRDKNIRWKRPYGTYLLMIVCTIMFFVSFFYAGWTISPFTENPMVGPSPKSLIKAGAKHTYKIVHEIDLIRLVSSNFLHAGYVHYVFNMASLWLIGAAVESNRGPIQVVVLFLLPSFGGSILSALFVPAAITVTASAGTLGLIGACLVDISHNW